METSTFSDSKIMARLQELEPQNARLKKCTPESGSKRTFLLTAWRGERAA
jgi:hypothetical protein